MLSHFAKSTMYAYVGIADRCPFRLTFAPFWCIICVKMSKIILCKNVIFACDINTFKEIFMKKRILIATLAIAVIIASMVALAACNINLDNLDTKAEASSTDYDGSKMICDDFLQNTFASDNYVMTITSGDYSCVLKVDGTKKSVQVGNLTTIYFEYEGKYYFANISEAGANYSEIDKAGFDEALEVETLKFRTPYETMIENAQYDCSMHEEGTATKDGFKGTGTLSLTISNDADRTVYTATAKDGRVETFTLQYTSDGETTNYNATVTYGNASIELDLEHWTNLDEE